MSTFPQQEGPPRLARGLYKRFALGALVIMLMATVSSATAVLLEVDRAADIFEEFSVPIAGLEGEEETKNVLDDVAAGKPQTIVILGSDQRYIDRVQKNAVRSDTIILVRLDPSKGATAIMSLPRDLVVDIPGFGRDRINAAYALGGPALTVRTVRQLLDIPINHVVNVNFGGFRRAVDRVGCIYVDVDRKYFNDNNPPAGGGPGYATIDVPAGYQRLCGQDALDYVRFRHLDSDVVRAARQQDFLRQAKDQIGVSEIFGDREELLKIFARYTQTDIRGTSAILRLLKLVFESSKNPLQEVSLTMTDGEGGALQASSAAVRAAAERFMNAKGTPGARAEAEKTSEDRSRERSQRRTQRRRGRSSVPRGLFEARRVAEDQAITLGARLAFPVYFPRFAAIGSEYVTTHGRTYDIFDRGRRKYRAYRMVVSAPGIGQYYGIQGTTWKAPPILDNPSETRRINGRTYELHFDGDRLRLVAWRTDKAVYWVTNTLLQSLTNRQMLGIAGSLTRVGAK